MLTTPAPPWSLPARFSVTLLQWLLLGMSDHQGVTMSNWRMGLSSPLLTSDWADFPKASTTGSNRPLAGNGTSYQDKVATPGTRNVSTQKQIQQKRKVSPSCDPPGSLYPEEAGISLPLPRKTRNRDVEKPAKVADWVSREEKTKLHFWFQGLVYRTQQLLPEALLLLLPLTKFQDPLSIFMLSFLCSATKVSLPFVYI